MVDTLAILFSTLACLFMMLRASRLDRRHWQAPPKPVLLPAAPPDDHEPPAWTPAWGTQQTTDLDTW